MHKTVYAILLLLSVTLNRCSGKAFPEKDCIKEDSLPGEEILSINCDSCPQVLGIKVSNLEWRYNVGDPMPITLRIRNYGCKPTEAHSSLFRQEAKLRPFITVWVRKEDKKYAIMHTVKLPVENRIRVEKKEPFEYEIDISKLKMLSEPGTYFISAGQINYNAFAFSDWIGNLRSREQMAWIEP